jgi:hypothetical protein
VEPIRESLAVDEIEALRAERDALEAEQQDAVLARPGHNNNIVRSESLLLYCELVGRDIVVLYIAILLQYYYNILPRPPIL